MISIISKEHSRDVYTSLNTVTDILTNKFLQVYFLNVKRKETIKNQTYVWL